MVLLLWALITAMLRYRQLCYSVSVMSQRWLIHPAHWFRSVQIYWQLDTWRNDADFSCVRNELWLLFNVNEVKCSSENNTSLTRHITLSTFAGRSHYSCSPWPTHPPEEKHAGSKGIWLSGVSHGYDEMGLVTLYAVEVSSLWCFLMFLGSLLKWSRQGECVFSLSGLGCLLTTTGNRKASVDGHFDTASHNKVETYIGHWCKLLQQNAAK